VSRRRTEVDPDRVACVVNWLFPTNFTKLRGFLGLCSYYRAFCKNLASIAKPVNECLRKFVLLTWTEEKQVAFDKLKKLLISALVLTMPRDDKNCFYPLDTDASNFGASSVLQQWQNGELRVIEYASRTLNTAERAYCTTRKEMAALIFGVKEYRCYLLGRHFQIRVVHAALTFYKKHEGCPRTGSHVNCLYNVF